MRKIFIILASLILWGAFLLPPGLWALTSNKDITVDDDSGDSPQIIMRDQDEKTLILQKLDTGEGNISNSEGAINILPSTDTVHYLSLSTASNLTGIYWKGHYTNDPAIRINSSGKLEYRDENESTWTTLDSLAGGGGGTGDVTGPGSATDNALSRFDGTTGKTLQSSIVTLSDTAVLDGISSLGFSANSAAVDASIYRQAAYSLRTTAYQLDRDVQNSFFKIVAGTDNSQDASLELYGSVATGHEGRVRFILPPVASAKGFDIIQGGGSWPTLMSIASTGEAVFNTRTTGVSIATFNNTSRSRTSYFSEWGDLYIDNAAAIYTPKLRILEGGASPTEYTIFQGGTQSGDITYTLPVDDGTVGQVLRSDGSGVLTWIDNYNPSGTDVAVADGGTGSSDGSITGTSALVFTAGGTDKNVILQPSGTGNIVFTSGANVRAAYVNQWGDVYTDPAGALYTNTVKSYASSSDLTIDTTGTGDLALQVTASGGVGIGTNAPGVKFDVIGGSGRVESGQSWLTTSDVRYKTNITTLEGALPKVLALRGVRYDMKTDKNITPGKGKQIGFIAQELEQQFPEFVVTDNKGYKAVAYDKLTTVLVNAIKEQQAQIEELKKQIATLQKQSK